MPNDTNNTQIQRIILFKLIPTTIDKQRYNIICSYWIWNNNINIIKRHSTHLHTKNYDDFYTQKWKEKKLSEYLNDSVQDEYSFNLF